jgi:hypothetical protein
VLSLRTTVGSKGTRFVQRQGNSTVQCARQDPSYYVLRQACLPLCKKFASEEHAPACASYMDILRLSYVENKLTFQRPSTIGDCEG